MYIHKCVCGRLSIKTPLQSGSQTPLGTGGSLCITPISLLEVLGYVFEVLRMSGSLPEFLPTRASAQPGKGSRTRLQAGTEDNESSCVARLPCLEKSMSRVLRDQCWRVTKET